MFYYFILFTQLRIRAHGTPVGAYEYDPRAIRIGRESTTELWMRVRRCRGRSSVEIEVLVQGKTKTSNLLPPGCWYLTKLCLPAHLGGTRERRYEGATSLQSYHRGLASPSSLQQVVRCIQQIVDEAQISGWYKAPKTVPLKEPCSRLGVRNIVSQGRGGGRGIWVQQKRCWGLLGSVVAIGGTTGQSMARQGNLIAGSAGRRIPYIYQTSIISMRSQHGSIQAL